ncbi:MAG: tetratricopeptide repeat protein, partial [Cellulophaga baltica]
MKLFLSLFIFLCVQWSSAQENYVLAKQYLIDGDFDKAVVYFEKLVKQNPYRSDYSEDLITCYQQLEQYADAERVLISRLESKKSHPVLIVDLGYNYTLQ